MYNNINYIDDENDDDDDDGDDQWIKNFAWLRIYEDKIMIFVTVSVIRWKTGQTADNSNSTFT